MPTKGNSYQIRKMTVLVDFSKPELCAQTRPVQCLINGQVVILDKYNWSSLLVAITELFIKEDNPKLHVLDGKPIYGNKPFFNRWKADTGACSKLSNGKWLYTNYVPQTIVKIIGKLCLHCDVPLNNVFISYRLKESCAAKNTRDHTILTRSISDKTKISIEAVLEKHFPNGIRPASIIDINKLKNFYFAFTCEHLPADIEISSLLLTIGIKHKDKVFAISSSNKKDLMKLIDDLISEDNLLFFYEELYDAHAVFLQKIQIFSPELLKTVLSGILPFFRYSRIFFSIDKRVTAESEVLRCYETAVCLSYEQLKEKLPYVPIDKIKQVLSQNQDFIWVSAGVYTHTSKLEIDTIECQAIEQQIEGIIDEQGYVSLANIDFFNNDGRNPDLSEIAVRNGLFQKCFTDRYEKRGNIITPKGSVLNSYAVFKEYCLSHSSLTLDKLLGFEKEISFNGYNQSLFVAYENMIRINKDTFVSDNEIEFNIELTDKALARFVHRNVIPLRAVTSLTLFPHIDGYPWNLFLLESYCRRFSNLFAFQCLSANSRNVGAICRKSAGFTDYPAVLAYAVANSGVRLHEKDVADFLFNSGYVARRTGIIAEVITKAQMLRER